MVYSSHELVSHMLHTSILNKEKNLDASCNSKTHSLKLKCSISIAVRPTFSSIPNLYSSTHVNTNPSELANTEKLLSPILGFVKDSYPDAIVRTSS